MGNYKLNKNDYEIINDLIKTSNLIMSLYNELYQLEITGKKQTNEYQLILEQIKQQLVYENNIYEKIGTSYSRSNSIMSYLIKNNEQDLKSQNCSKMLIEFDKILVISRIVAKLLDNNKDEIKDKLPIEDSVIDSNFKVREYIILDIINCLLAIISSKYENNSLNITNQLNKIKYTISYLYSNVEREMIESNFEVDKNPYISYRFVGQINKWKLENIEKIKTLYGISFYNEILYSMLVLDDDDLENNDKMVELIFFQSYLRAILILLDDETIMDLNSKFHDLIDEDDLQEIFEKREKIIDAVIKAFKCVKSDREIPKILSLKKF